MPTDLFIVVETRNGIGVLRASGEIDLSTAPRLAAAIEAALLPRVPLVLDLTGVGFMDSSGARVLVFADQHARELASRLLIAASESVRLVFGVAGLDRMLNVHSVLQDALDAAARWAPPEV